MGNSVISKILLDYTLSWEKILFTYEGKQYEVVPPYIINSEDAKFKANRNSTRWADKSRKTGYLYSLDDAQKLCVEQDGVDPSGSSLGKARPEVIQKFLEMEAGNIMKEGKDFREALLHYGIGVDCSGFVSRALARVMNELHISEELKEATLGYTSSGKLKSNTTTLCAFDDHQKISGKSGITIVKPLDIQPGDILYRKNSKGFHIIIVIDVIEKNNNEIRFITAESTSYVGKQRVLRKEMVYKESSNTLQYRFWDENSWANHPDWKDGTCNFGRPRAFQHLDENIESKIIVENHTIVENQTEDYTECDSIGLTDDNILFGITASNANLRKEASDKSAIVSVVPQGSILRYERTQGIVNGKYTWYQIQYNGVTGYLANVTFVADLSPVCVGYVDAESTLALLIASFNAETGSRRIFNEVHYIPATEKSEGDEHLTIGFGHFAGGTQDKFIESMMNNSEMRNVLVGCFESAFKANPKFIKKAQEEGYAISFDESTQTISGVDSFLRKLNMENHFINAGNKYKFPGGGVKNGYWFNDILVDVLTNEYICSWQIKFWIENTLSDAIDLAAELGLEKNYGAVATLVSLRSSGLMNVAGIKNEIGAPVTAKEKDYAAMKLWLYYNSHKNQIILEQDRK